MSSRLVPALASAINEYSRLHDPAQVKQFTCAALPESQIAQEALAAAGEQ